VPSIFLTRRKAPRRSSTHTIKRLQDELDRLLSGRENLRVLDAGCGRGTWHWAPYDFGPGAHVVGLDPSRSALALNETADETVVGDIETDPLPMYAFDLILCWDVLEHLSSPKKALGNLIQALTPGGIVLLKVPNVLSPKGLVTKLTPLRFHVWLYRAVAGYAEAGTEGHGPYRTYMRLSLAPSALQRFARENGLRVEVFELFSADYWQRALERRPVLGRAWQAVGLLYWLLTFGKDPRLTEVALILRKVP
jgi:SAM-dependent methyltransferase